MKALIIILIGMLLATLLFAYLIIRVAIHNARLGKIYKNLWHISCNAFLAYRLDISNELKELHKKHPKTKWLEEIIMFEDYAYSKHSLEERLEEDKKHC